MQIVVTYKIIKMQFRIAVLFICIIGLGVNKSNACDVCGCGISGIGIGMMTSYRNNFVRLSWQSARYQSMAEYGGGSEDFFQLIDLSGRYYLNERFKVNMNLPYRINHRVNTSEDRYVYGVSDMRILGNYSWIDNLLMEDGSSLLFETGLGLKLPTGEYDPKIHDTNLPENFNIGQGNYGLLFEPALVYNANPWVFSVIGSGQWNSRSRDQYQYGHQYAGRVAAYRNFYIGQVTIVPGIGVSAESIGKDHYKNGGSVHGTGGQGISASGGVNFQFAKCFSQCPRVNFRAYYTYTFCICRYIFTLR